jgi:hypothetical protein
MGDYDSVDLIGRDVLQQSRHGRISDVEYEPKVILLNQKAAARLTCGRPSSARPQNRHPHRLYLRDEGLALSNLVPDHASFSGLLHYRSRRAAQWSASVWRAVCLLDV